MMLAGGTYQVAYGTKIPMSRDAIDGWVARWLRFSLLLAMWRPPPPRHFNFHFTSLGDFMLAGYKAAAQQNTVTSK